MNRQFVFLSAMAALLCAASSSHALDDHYKPCFEEPVFETSELALPTFVQPEFEVHKTVEANFEKPQYVRPEFEKPLIARPEFEKPVIIKPQFDNRCDTKPTRPGSSPFLRIEPRPIALKAPLPQGHLAVMAKKNAPQNSLITQR
jgi:hypothetical protein